LKRLLVQLLKTTLLFAATVGFCCAQSVVASPEDWPRAGNLSNTANSDALRAISPLYPAPRPGAGDVGFGNFAGSISNTNARVLPVLSSGDGRIEALLFIDAPLATHGSANPMHQLLGIDLPEPAASGRFGLNLNSKPSKGLTLSAGLQADTGLALLCNDDIGLATTLTSLSQHCLLTRLGDNQDLLGPFSSQHTRQQHVSASLNLPRYGLDLSFGLAWLQSRPAPSLLLSGVDSDGQRALQVLDPSLTDGTFGSFSLSSRSLGVRGLLDLGSRRWMSLTGEISRSRVDRGVIEALLPPEWSSGRLGLGLGYGPFSGAVSGHVVGLDGGDTLWGGLDIGLSWRTPWRAALTIGARNLVSGSKGNWPSENSKALEQAQGRVPYVQYQQDL